MRRRGLRNGLARDGNQESGDREWVGHEKTGVVGDQPRWMERSLRTLVALHGQSHTPKPLLAQEVTRTQPRNGSSGRP